MTSIRSAFIVEMYKVGIETKDQLIADGRLHRFNVCGDRKGTKNGWYILYPDFPTIGVFGCWKRHIRYKWQPYKDGSLIIADLRKLHNRIQSIKEQCASEYKSEHGALLESAAIWQNAKSASNRHGYLVRKGVQSHGLRYHRGALLIPVTDPYGNFHGMQRIWPNGDKRIRKGTIVSGNYYMIGIPTNATLLICESYSTGATLHEVSGLAVIVTFGSGNLRSAAEVVRAAWPSFRMIICADDDHNQPGNPGMSAAVEAAATINAEILIPVFSSNRGTDDTDFNDMLRIDGASAVFNFLRNGGLCNV